MSTIDIASPVLRAENVVLARDGKRFAKLPDLCLTRRQTVALVGPSGCGKTTALLALAGVRKPVEGRIEIDGVDVWKLRRSSRDGFRGRRIGLVFQSFHLVDALTVGQNVWLAAQCADFPLQEPNRLEKLLTQLGLAELRNRRVDHISHGQAQRVAVARALLNHPAVVLADEPTSALDDGNTAELMSLLAESARQSDAALVVATHDRRVLNAVETVVEMKTLP